MQDLESPNTLYVLCGLPRSGKSTWARSDAFGTATRGLGRAIVSGDAIRRALYGRRFWMPGDRLVQAHAWVMVRSLFVAGHHEVIVDDTNLDARDIRFWRCERTAATPIVGGDQYPPLLPIDRLCDDDLEKVQAQLDHEQFERHLADELQGDVIAWKRHVIAFTTPWEVCRDNAERLANYNQRISLVGYIELQKHWTSEFIARDNLLDSDEHFMEVPWLSQKSLPTASGT